MSKRHIHESNADIYYAVRGALVARGDSLTAWCRRHEITRQWGEDVLRGRRTGPAAQKLRARLLKLLDTERCSAPAS